MSHRFFAIVGLLLILGPLPAQDPDVLNIGLVDSLVQDLSPGRREFIDTEFTSMVKDFTGLRSKIFQGGTPSAAGKKIAEGQWHFAVFQGIEFGWAQAKDPTLEPLMVAIYKQRTSQAQLVVKKDSTLAGFADLKGKEIGLLKAKVHCRLFANKGAAGQAKGYFGMIVAEANLEAALDNVLLDKVSAAIVDNTAMDIYKEIHPGRFARLKILARSESFPQGVIAYRKGSLSDSFLTKFRTGMLKVDQSEKGREVLATFQLSTFEAVPDDYPEVVKNILKAYPTPE